MKTYWQAGSILLLAAGLFLLGCGSGVAEQPVPKAAAQQGQASFPVFRARDLQGSEVTSEIFAKKKITVVNIWGTFCPPCIGEMPELGKWAKDMPAEAQLVGIVCDVRGGQDVETIGAAQDILAKAGADFVNLVPDEAIMEYLEGVEAVPTTIFVDAEGKLVGEPVVGADVDAYKVAVEAYLHD
ncbi:MAG: TlpA family protein disulfide reductase [Selenomonadaceae bacterium]|nr:TlpA family protein disulfide reductase [Selenomonadaceae bacterium]